MSRRVPNQWAFWKDKFNPAYYSKKCEVIPILALCAYDLVFASFCCIWFTFSKPDVEFFKTQKKPWDRIDLRHPRVYKFNFPRYQPLEDLATIYDSMEEEERKRRGDIDDS